MTRDLGALASETFDVLVVGGGIHGLTIAYDAAQRGLRVALIERRDFGSGTSFNHHKTLHGGLRYLQSFDIGRMRTSIVERRAFARIASSLISPLAFVMPTRRAAARSRWAMRAALFADRLVAWDRNAGVPVPHALPGGRIIDRDELYRLFPDASFDDATGAALWYDYRTDEGDRLTFAFADAAARCGAVLANYVSAIEPLRDDGRITGMALRDELSGAGLVARAAVTVNAAGAAAGRLMASFGARRPFPLVKVMNVVTRRPAPPVALARPTHTGRLLVALPWQGRLLVGTSQATALSGADETHVNRVELSGFLVEVNAAFPWLALGFQDVSLVHRGIVPARQRPGAPPELLDAPEVRDHRRDQVYGAISVIGVKYTTARSVAERSVDLVCRMLGRAPVPARTATEPLLEPSVSSDEGTPANMPPAAAERILRRHAGAARRIFALARHTPSLARPVATDTPVIGAELVYAARHECALTLEDAVVRRTGLGAAGHPGEDAARACAEIMASELGWTPERIEDELRALRSVYEVDG
jgi:glycerol-3-phosphate dehydrogenase